MLVCRPTDHERDGSCVDVVRVRDNGNTLFESCGTLAGVKVISNTNVVTLNLVASAKLYPARGFFLQYQGSYMRHIFLLPAR